MEEAAAKGKTAGASQSKALGPWQKETPKVGTDWQGRCGQQYVAGVAVSLAISFHVGSQLSGSLELPPGTTELGRYQPTYLLEPSEASSPSARAAASSMFNVVLPGPLDAIQYMSRTGKQ